MYDAPFFSTLVSEKLILYVSIALFIIVNAPPFFFKIRLSLLEIEASGVAIGKGGGREREKGDEHRRKRKSIHQEGKKKLPKKKKDFVLRQYVMNGRVDISSLFRLQTSVYKAVISGPTHPNW